MHRMSEQSHDEVRLHDPLREDIRRLGHFLGESTMDKEQATLQHGARKLQPCQLSSGCFPNGQQWNEDDAPGWVKELERVTKKVNPKTWDYNEAATKVGKFCQIIVRCSE